MLLEVAISTVEDALAAHAGGADRLELCAALELDGLTPSLGTLIEIRHAAPLPLLSPLPVMVMIRPRPGPFVYSDADFRTMLRDADLALAHGADGLVFGCLTADRSIDRDQTRELIRRAGAKASVFHRAFDAVRDPLAALETLIDLGATRVLTSGQQPTALAGAALIRQLIGRADGRIEVLPGGGVTPDNAAELIRLTGAAQIHGSFSDATPFRATSFAKVRAARAALSGTP